MFYSHQLLARKAPLGQIWMAATMHAKINRKKLDQLNIIKICEEILKPSIPMALELSGIIIGGVVIVYERKVKLLYDDVTRLLVEINKAWKVNAAPDPTVLPKGKSHAKHEAVTLPENEGTDIGEIERSLHFSNNNAPLGFERTAYFALRPDNVQEPPMNDNGKEEDASQHYHQVDAANITLFERFNSYQADANLYIRFERFDIEGDEETQLNFTSGGNTQIPTTLVLSPPPQDQPLKAAGIEDQPPEHQVNQQWFECKEALQRLDNVQEPYMNDNGKEDDASQHYHQVDAANITLFKRSDSYQTDANLYNRFERYEAVTLPENEGTDVGELEQSLHFSNTNGTLEFERTSYFAMQLDNVQEPYMNDDGKEDDASQHDHQVVAANDGHGSGGDSVGDDSNGGHGSGGDSAGDDANVGHGSGGDDDDGDGDHNGGDGDDQDGGGGDKEDGGDGDEEDGGDGDDCNDPDIILGRRIIELAEEQKAKKWQMSKELHVQMRLLEKNLDIVLIIDIIHGLAIYKTWTLEQRSRALALANAVARAAGVIAVPPPPIEARIAVVDDMVAPGVLPMNEENVVEEDSDESTASS